MALCVFLWFLYEFCCISIIGIKPSYLLSNLMNKWVYRAYLAIWGASQKLWGNLEKFWALCLCVPHAKPSALCSRCVPRQLEVCTMGGLCVRFALCVRCIPICIRRLAVIASNLLQTTQLHTPRLCNVFPMPLIAQWLGFWWEFVYKDLEVTVYIFSFSKIPFSNIMLDTFSLTLKQPWFSLFLWILAQVMKFLTLFAWISWRDIWLWKPLLHLKK